MSNSLRKNLWEPDQTFYALKLATMLYNPPWKPWAGMRGFGSVADDILKAIPQASAELTSVCSERKGDPEALALAAALAAAVKDTDAYRVASEALRLLCNDDERVRRANQLALNFERLLLNKVEEVLGLQGSGSTGKVMLKNQFNPSYELEVSLPKREDVVEYVRRLTREVSAAVKAVSHSEAARLLPHIVLTFMEHLWYEASLPAPPADLRIPNHTVFDHQTAAAAVANWVQGKEGLKGCLVVVDLASVQAWVGEARRLRDLWGASWLASWLAWATVRRLVEIYGPDVLLQPPARLNPFYLAWLLGRGIRGCCSAAEELEKLVLPLGWPVDPTTPSRVILILPPNVCRDLKGMLWNEYSSSWGKVVSMAVDYLNTFYEVLKKGLADLQTQGRLASEDVGISRNVSALLTLKDGWDAIKSELSNIEPPLPLRIFVIDVGRAYESYMNDYLNKVKGNAIERIERENLGRRDVLVRAVKSIGEELFYDYLLRSALPREESFVSGFKLSRRSGAGYYRYAENVYKAYMSGGGSVRTAVRLCTVCGRAPAVIAVPEDSEMSEALKGVGWQDILRDSGAWKARQEVMKARKVMQEVEGERLCPYCFIKRILRRMLLDDPSFAKELVGLEPLQRNRNASERPAGLKDRLSGSVDVYTSKLHLNLKPLAEELVKYVKDLSFEDIIKLCALMKSGLLTPIIGRWLHRLSESGVKSIVESVAKDDPDMAGVKKPSDLRELIKKKIKNKVKGKVKDESSIEALADELAESLEATIPSIAVDKALARAIRDRANEMKSEAILRLVEFVERATREGGAYYAIVAGDGDYMGSGVLAGKLGMPPDEYIDTLTKNVLTDDLREPLKQLYKAVLESVDKVSKTSGCEEAVCKEDVRKCRTVIITPSYSYTVSRALAASSITDRDAVVSLGGFLTYAGGDDLLAILPPASVVIMEERGVVKERLVFNALKVARKTRRGYWGLDSRVQGFHTVGKAPVPAITAAGRSTVVYYARAKTPLWMNIERAHSLLNAKDRVGFHYVCGPHGGRVSCKDALTVAIEPMENISDAAILPLTIVGKGSAVAASVAAVEALLYSLDKRCNSGLVSSSILTDLMGEKGLMKALQHARGSVGERLSICLTLIGSLVRRNLTSRGRKELSSSTKYRNVGNDRLLEALLSLAGEAAGLDIADVGKYVKDLACVLTRRYCPGCDGGLPESPVLLELFKASRITKTARR